MPRYSIPLCATLAALVVAAGIAATGSAAPPEARAAALAAEWPVPVPGWFWAWARWYLGRGEFAGLPLRSGDTRPAAAPREIPGWAWRRLAVLLGQAPPPIPEKDPPPARPPARVWPAAIPDWFWPWARWYLGRAEYADTPLRAGETRPDTAPRLVPEWAWRRLTVLQGGTPPPLPAEPLAAGDRGRDVEALQLALKAAGYPVGAIDGRFGARTTDAVVAFEKVHRLRPDGTVSPEEFPRIVRSVPPSRPIAGRRYVYVDLSRQVLYEVRDGRVEHVLPVSTGGGYTYTGLDGRTHLARTPTGDFRVYRKVAGADSSYLGRLYNPAYFRGGYAIHGSSSVPVRPVSHGCIRIPRRLSAAFYRRTPIGTRVVIR